jgi:hypothetical protein
MRTETLDCDQCGKQITKIRPGHPNEDYLIVQPANDVALQFHGWDCAGAYAADRITEEGNGAPLARTKETNKAVLEARKREKDSKASS